MSCTMREQMIESRLEQAAPRSFISLNDGRDYSCRWQLRNRRKRPTEPGQFAGHTQSGKPDAHTSVRLLLESETDNSQQQPNRTELLSDALVSVRLLAYSRPARLRCLPFSLARIARVSLMSSAASS